MGGFRVHWVTHEALFAQDFVSLSGYWDRCGTHLGSGGAVLVAASLVRA